MHDYFHFQESKQTSKRKIASSTPALPGPDTYRIPIDKPGPSHSIHAKFKASLGFSYFTPGPNQYCPSQESSGKYATMKSRPSPKMLVFPSLRVNTLKC